MSAPFAAGAPERERLERLLAIPSISADPASGPAMAEARALLAAWLVKIGFERIEELEGGGHPALYAEWLHAPGAPDAPRLRPLRRPAAGPAGAVGQPALRGAGARRAPLRAGRIR